MDEGSGRTRGPLTWSAAYAWVQAKLVALRVALQSLPIVGLLLIQPVRQHLWALTQAILTALFGTIGIWVVALVISIKTNPVSLAPAWVELTKATLRGDVLIVVPSLVAPVFLLLFVTKDNPRIRRHQIGLFAFAILVSAAVSFVYLTKIASNVPDNGFLVAVSRLCFLTACAVLYLYFLLKDLPDELLPQIQASGANVERDLVEMRRERSHEAH